LRLGFGDCPIGFQAEIVPKPLVECLPFLLLPPPRQFRSSLVVHIAERNILPPIVIPPAIAKLKTQSRPTADRQRELLQKHRDIRERTGVPDVVASNADSQAVLLGMPMGPQGQTMWVANYQTNSDGSMNR
jgi:hypothetical protein